MTKNVEISKFPKEQEVTILENSCDSFQKNQPKNVGDDEDNNNMLSIKHKP